MTTGGSNAPPGVHFVHHLSENFGLRNVRSDWLAHHQSSAQNSLISALCNANLRHISQGSLPWRIQDAHSVQLGVKVLVQIDEVINVATPDPKASTPRLLQFALTDGLQDFIAVEIDAVRSRFSTKTVPGTKIVLLPGALVRRGRVLITSADYSFLGVPQHDARTNHGPGQGSAGVSSFRQPPGSNAGGSSNGGAANAAAGVITNIGGIANVEEPSDEGADHEGLWSEAPVGRNGFPMDMRAQAPSPVSTRNIATNAVGGPVRQRPLERQERNHANENAILNEHGMDAESGTRGDHIQAPNTSAPPVPEPDRGEDVFQGVVASQVSSEMAFQMMTNIPSPPDDDDVEIIESQSQEPLEGIGSMNIADLGSPALLHLSQLKDGDPAKHGICRLYAVKTGKRMDSFLNRGGKHSAIVDDGASVRVLPLSKEFFNILRKGFASEDDGHGPEPTHDIRRTVRSVCGFVHVEVQNNAPVATSYAWESAVPSAMLSHFLENVSTRFAAYTEG